MHTGEKADFFLELSAHDQCDLLLRLPQDQRHVWIRLLAPDDAADLLQEAGPENRDELIALLDEPTRKEVSALMAYKEDEAGGLMSPRFARVRPDSTVEEAISYLRKQAATVETIYYAYVLDHDQRLLGVFSLRELFSADPKKSVREIMHTDLIAVPEKTSQKAVADVVRDSRLMAVPVLDKHAPWSALSPSMTLSTWWKRKALATFKIWAAQKRWMDPICTRRFLSWSASAPAG